MPLMIHCWLSQRARFPVLGDLDESHQWRSASGQSKLVRCTGWQAHGLHRSPSCTVPGGATIEREYRAA